MMRQVLLTLEDLLACLLTFAENQAEVEMCTVDGNTKQWPTRRLECLILITVLKKTFGLTSVYLNLLVFCYLKYDLH